MKRSQWFVMAWGFLIISVFFLNLDVHHGAIVGDLCSTLETMEFEGEMRMYNKYEMGEISKEALDNYLDETNQLTSFDVRCLIGGRIYEPFVFLSYALFIIFCICGYLEPKKKKK